MEDRDADSHSWDINRFQDTALASAALSSQETVPALGMVVCGDIPSFRCLSQQIFITHLHWLSQMKVLLLLFVCLTILQQKVVST